MSKKSIALLLVLCLAIGSLAGCTKKTGDTSTTSSSTSTSSSSESIAATDPFPGADLGGVTIKVQGLQNPYTADAAKKDFWRARQAEVEKKFNIKLQFDATNGIDWNSVPAKVVASVAAGDPLFDVGNMSRYYIPELMNGNALLDLTQQVAAYKFPKMYYQDMAQWQGKTIGFSTSPYMTWSVFAYNKTLIKQAGMTKTPGEMFKEGKWSYDDFYTYLSELRSKLPADINIFGIHALTWGEVAGYANGGYLLNPKTYVPEYNKEPMIQAVQFMQKLVQNKLEVAPPPITRDDGSKGFDWNKVNAGWDTGKLVMWSAATWDFANIASKFDYGIVPPPWGPQVTVTNGDYKTLSENYRSALWDAGIWTITNNSKPKATPEQYINIVFSYAKEDADQFVIDQQKEAKGEAITSRDAGKIRDFTSDLDVELWDWYQSRTTFEPMNSSEVAAKPFRTLYWACATTEDPRALFDAVVGEDAYGMVDAKMINPADLTGDLKTQYDAYAATVKK